MIVSGRVRVAVRLRPRNSEEMTADADFADCVELQPEVQPYNDYMAVFKGSFSDCTVLGNWQYISCQEFFRSSQIYAYLNFVSVEAIETSKKQLGF